MKKVLRKIVGILLIILGLFIYALPKIIPTYEKYGFFVTFVVFLAFLLLLAFFSFLFGTGIYLLFFENGDE